jgi:hypothetical protein
MLNRMMLTGLLVFGAAACSGDGGTSGGGDGAATTPPAGGSAAATSSAAATGSPGSAPRCVTGRWRATAVASSGSVGEVRGRVSGGTGTVMTVSPDGRTEVDFQASRPLTFTAGAAGADIRGEVAYQGSFSGAVTFEPVDRDGTGRWDPEGDINWSGLRVTIRLREPFDITLLDGASMADLSGDTLPGTRGAVDIQPLLRGGTYTCGDDTLRVRTTENGPTLIWTFARV